MNRFGYTSFTQYFGAPGLEYNTAQYGLFIQDDWRVTPDLKVLLRRPLRLVRRARCGSERADRNLARVPDLEEQLRAARRHRLEPWRRQKDRGPRQPGMMYDQTLNAIYEQALANNGTNARASASFTPTQAGAPRSRRCSAPVQARRRTWRGRSTPTSRSRARGRTTCR